MLVPLTFGILQRLAILALMATSIYLDDHDGAEEEAMILLFNEVF
jgi:hypothetical protein